jgi:hypothetical protein
MKRLMNKTYKWVAVLLMLVASSCDSFLDINEDPNSVLEPPIQTILTSATADLGFSMGSDIHRYSSIFTQQFTGGGGPGVQTVEFSRYNLTETDVNNLWRNRIYAGILADLERVIQSAGTESPRYAGIAKILKAFTFSIAVDAWGNIPFDDALKFAENVKPRYDESSTIYPKLITLIDEGVAEMKSTTNVFTPGNDDLFYKGDIVKWEKFANALKLRLYIHHFPKFAADGQAGIAALLASNAPLMTSNADNFQMLFETSADRTNGIDQFEKRRINQFFPTSTIIGLMNGKSDPRSATYFTNGGSTTATAAAPGQQLTTVTFLRMHTFLRGAVTNAAAPTTGYAGDSPTRILTFAEQNFILAEYYARTNDLAQAETFFRAGISASMQVAGANVDLVPVYLAAQGTLTAGDAIRKIIEEKYVANFGVAVEPWTDWRRTGFPSLTPVAGATLPAIPRVLPYSDLERVTNRDNTPARTDITVPGVFWDPAM